MFILRFVSLFSFTKRFVIWQGVFGVLSIPAALVLLVGLMMGETFVNKGPDRRVSIFLALTVH